MIPKPKNFIQKSGPSATLGKVENSKGYVELKMDPAIRKMSRELSKMNQTLGPLINEAIDLSREISGSMAEVAARTYKLGQVCANIHKSYKSVGDKFDFESLSKIDGIFSELSKTLTSYSKVLVEERDNFQANIESLFSFTACEIDGIDEILNLRNEFSIEYKEKRQVLDAKKEASFPLMDLRKWEVDQDNLTVPKTQLFQDKATALKYMFPKDTQDVKNLRDFWAYCNALIGSELREFGHMVINRLQSQLGAYVEGFNRKLNKTLSLFIDLQTKLVTTE